MAMTRKAAEDDLRFSSIALSAVEEAHQTALDERASLCRKHRGSAPDAYEVFAEWWADELTSLLARAEGRITALAPRIIAAAEAQEAEDAAELETI